jgi:ATP-binding cassette subfamily F protein uup
VDAAQALIADVPPLRDKVELTKFATARLGKTVYDVEDVTLHLGGEPVFEHVTWRLGPGDRIGLVGINGSGKTTMLRLLAGTVQPESGRIVRGKTVALAHLSQELAELDPQRRVLESVEEIARRITVGKREWTAGQLLERLGFRADAQWKPVGDLSGGERRRLQILRLLMGEPNVMLLDEPTNDLDIETLTELEDILDGWPGTLVVVSHDRYFLERVTDVVYALLGDGTIRMLTGGVDEYLQRVEAGTVSAVRNAPSAVEQASSPGEAKPVQQAKLDWKTQKELDRLERRLGKLSQREEQLHAEMAGAATDHSRLMKLDEELKAVLAEKDEVEMAWLELADAG